MRSLLLPVQLFGLAALVGASGDDHSGHDHGSSTKAWEWDGLQVLYE